jgi:hypothetical protein
LNHSALRILRRQCFDRTGRANRGHVSPQIVQPSPSPWRSEVCRFRGSDGSSCQFKVSTLNGRSRCVSASVAESARANKESHERLSTTGKKTQLATNAHRPPRMLSIARRVHHRPSSAALTTWRLPGPLPNAAETCAPFAATPRQRLIRDCASWIGGSIPHRRAARRPE